MFKNLKVRSRLNIILIASTLALLAVGMIGLINGRNTRVEIDHVYYGGVDRIDQLVTISKTTSNQMVRPLRQVELGAITFQQAQQGLLNASSTINATWKQYISETPYLAESSMAEQKSLLVKGQQIIPSLDGTFKRLQEAANSGNKQQLNTLIDSEFIPLIEDISAITDQLIALHATDSKADYLTAISNSSYYEATTLIALLISISILVPLTIISTRGIVIPLEHAVECIAVCQDIVTSLTHLSSGASETASAVTETTTTVEELKQTANISVDKAKDVLSNSQETLSSANSSETSVTATITDINQIRDRMQVISDSILKLSEKSLAIAEIIDSVSDIAEQSNLLAVNAAIESAKAGEVGRSFGVVAQEIRSLAEQSKGATVQVKSLLAEIQTATNAAVLATEQGTKAVAKGVDQSTQTNETIKDLVSKITRVTQAANQIVLSNQQQLVGTEQITVAMTQINEATSQHVEHLAQIESAVATLTQAGSALMTLTDKYRTSDTTTRSCKTRHTTKTGSRQTA